jgi:AcrR family transcriptional regulator
MSSNKREPDGKPDRRVTRTRDRLGDALIDLIQEKPFDDLTVQDVLDRAGVSRSTFYAHYRDKNDLFMSDVDEFLGHMAGMLSQRRESSDRVAPVREFFAHVADQEKLHAALVESGRIHEFTDLARDHFARGIEQRLAERPRSGGIEEDERRALSQALAGAMLSLMSWWLAHGRPESPEEMDRLFHRIVWAGVASGRSQSAATSRPAVPPDA